MDELSVTVLAVLWRSEDGARVVARVRDGSGESVTVTGHDRPESPLSENLSFRLLGRWDDHPKFGRQFRFEAAALAAPIDEKGMVAYLTTLVDRVGVGRASRLWELYGDRAAEVLREEPLRVVAAGVMGGEDARAASETLKRHQAHERTLLELLSLLAGRGFGRRLPQEAVKLWGARATERVRRNPYLLLLRGLPGAGWKRCDKLWLDLGHPAGAPKRQVMAAVAHLREGHGDTWHDAGSVAGAIVEACGARADPKRALRVAERWGKVVILRGQGKPLVALAEHAGAEARLAASVKELLAWTKRGSRYRAPERLSA